MSSKLFSSAIVENPPPVVKELHKEGYPGSVAVFKSAHLWFEGFDTCYRPVACSTREASKNVGRVWSFASALAGKLVFKYEQKRQNLSGIWTVDIPPYVILSQGQLPFHFLAVRFQLCDYKLHRTAFSAQNCSTISTAAVPDILNVHKNKYFIKIPPPPTAHTHKHVRQILTPWLGRYSRLWHSVRLPYDRVNYILVCYVPPPPKKKSLS